MLRALLWLLAFVTVLMATELRPSHGEPRMGAVAFSSGSDAAAAARPGPAIVRRRPVALPPSGIVTRSVTERSPLSMRDWIDLRGTSGTKRVFRQRRLGALPGRGPDVRVPCDGRQRPRFAGLAELPVGMFGFPSFVV